MELPLQGCSVTYLPKDSKKKQHELRITQQGTDPLVLAVQSKEQAEQWLKVSCRLISEPFSLPNLFLRSVFIFIRTFFKCTQTWINLNRSVFERIF